MNAANPPTPTGSAEKSEPPASPKAPAGQPSNWRLVARLIGLAWQYRLLSLKVIVLQVTLLVMTISGLGLTGLAIDFLRQRMDPSAPEPRWWFGIAPPADWPPMMVIAMLALGIGGLALLRMVFNYGVTVAQTDLIQRRITVKLRKDVYDKLQRLSFRFFDDNESGSIINRVAGDVSRTSKFLTGVLFSIINVVIALSVYIVYMFSIHTRLTWAVLVTMPVLAGLAYGFSRLVRKDTEAYLAASDKMVLTLSEDLQGMHVVKGFARQDDEIRKFRKVTKRVHDKQTRIFRRSSIFSPLMVFLTQVNTMIVLAYGGYLVVQHEINPAQGIALGAGLFVFAGLVGQFSSQVQTLANITNQAQEYLTSAARVFEILDSPLEIQTEPNAVALPRARGRLKFEHVTFGYKPQDPVLHDITFEAAPGECVAILGPTGSGKSTLLSLIPRFYDPQTGRVLLDGIDVRDLDLGELRRNIGLVFQESFLFSNTIAWNIAFGNPDATREQIVRAAKIACAHEFIEKLPKGYDTIIGERGTGLSGGQRQRLAIARALLLEPPILLLDDPTAAVDPETEHEMLRAIDNAMKDRTTFLVAHRLSTLRRADKVIVLDQGRIVQVGTHEELMNIKGHYRRAARLQEADEESKRLLGVAEEVGTA